MPRSHVTATAVLIGTNARFGGQGFVEAAGADRLTAPFTLDQYGRGVFGPLALAQQGGGSALGAFYLARDRSESAFWVDARRLAIAAPTHPPSFEHLHLPALPALAGTVSATVGGAGRPSAFALVGRVRAHDLRFGTVRITDASADLGGSPSDVRAGAVQATGPWGRFSGVGGFGPQGLALTGRYSGSLEALEAFTGPVGGQGPLDLPVAILASTAGTVVQTTGGATAGASVHAIPIERVAGTLVAGQSGLRILAATAGIAGGRLVAAGNSARGIGLSAAGVQARRLAGAGIPLDDGTIALVGTAKVGPGPLAFDGGAVLAGGRFRSIPIAANGNVGLAGADVTVRRVDGSAYRTWGSIDGRIANVASPARRYDLNARVRAADVGDIADAAGIAAAARYHIDGSAEADLVVKGHGEQPVVDGQLRIPESTVNGLFIADAAARIVASPTSLALFGGHASVGTTHATFDGSLYRRRQLAFSFDAGAADLSDFDNFFDPGDMLSGKGHVSFSVLRRHGNLTTTGNIGMQGLRVAHAYFGSAATRWSSAGERIQGSAGFDGRAGALQTSGSVSVPRRGRLVRVIGRSSFDLRVHATKFERRRVDGGARLRPAGRGTGRRRRHRARTLPGARAHRQRVARARDGRHAADRQTHGCRIVDVPARDDHRRERPDDVCYRARLRLVRIPSARPALVLGTRVEPEHRHADRRDDRQPDRAARRVRRQRPRRRDAGAAGADRRLRPRERGDRRRRNPAGAR